MKRSRCQVRAFVAGCLLVIPANVSAEESKASVFTEARLDVPVRISVAARTPTIDLTLPNVTGEINCSAEFGVEGNTPRVRMFAEATALYFKGEVGSQEVAPIPLHAAAGAEIEAVNATVENQNGTRVPFVGEGDAIDQFPTQKTGEIVFKSDREHTFEHSVFVTLKWLQEDPNKPAGQYKGKVKLTCMALAPP